MEAKCVSFSYKSWDGCFVLKSESGMVEVVEFDEEMKEKRRESKEKNRAKESEEGIVLVFWEMCLWTQIK